MMNDLIYGGTEYENELKGLFPSAVFSDASDEIHEGRISIDIEIDREEYYRIIFLNGFGKLSLSANLIEPSELKPWLRKWEEDYPEYFNQGSDEQ